MGTRALRDQEDPLLTPMFALEAMAKCYSAVKFATPAREVTKITAPVASVPGTPVRRPRSSDGRSQSSPRSKCNYVERKPSLSDLASYITRGTKKDKGKNKNASPHPGVSAGEGVIRAMSASTATTPQDERVVGRSRYTLPACIRVVLEDTCPIGPPPREVQHMLQHLTPSTLLGLSEDERAAMLCIINRHLHKTWTPAELDAIARAALGPWNPADGAVPDCLLLLFPSCFDPWAPAPNTRLREERRDEGGSDRRCWR